jgi:hypothetical protein
MSTQTETNVLTDSAAFAAIVEGALFNHIPAFDATPESAAYDAARQRFLTAHPEFQTATLGDPWPAMDEAVAAAMGAAFCRGIAIGTAIECLRTTVAPPSGT